MSSRRDLLFAVAVGLASADTRLNPTQTRVILSLSKEPAVDTCRCSLFIPQDLLLPLFCLLPLPYIQNPLKKKFCVFPAKKRM
jgi:hypothetical protein